MIQRLFEGMLTRGPRSKWGLLSLAPQATLSLLLPAIEQPGKATMVSVSRQLLLYVPVMLTLPRALGLNGIYYGATSIDLLCALWLLAIVITALRRTGAN